MMDSWDNRLGNPFSFHPDFSDLREKIKDQLTGGMCLIQQRHIEVNTLPNNYPRVVNYSPSGEPYKKLVFYDHNSLYPYR